MRRIPLDETYVQGQVSVCSGPDWIQPWRAPWREVPAHHPSMGDRLQACAGVRLRFATTSPSLSLEVVPAEEARLFDLVEGATLLETAVLPPRGRIVSFQPLPAGRKTLEIWLSRQNGALRLRALFVDDTAACGPAPDRRKRWIVYGSSITQCAGAHSPARTWPGTAARLADVHHTNLGMRGQCHLDPVMARIIRDLPADLITLKLGINVQGGGTFNDRSYGPAVTGMVLTIRDGHPHTPIVLIDPILSPPRETAPNACGMSLEHVRALHREVRRRLARAFGERNLFVVDGRTLMGEGQLGYLPDQLHPDGDGYEVFGRRAFRRILKKYLG